MARSGRDGVDRDDPGRGDRSEYVFFAVALLLILIGACIRPG